MSCPGASGSSPGLCRTVGPPHLPHLPPQGWLHPAARRGGVLAGPNQPPARPHRLPPPAGRCRAPRAHDAARGGRVGVRAPRPLRLPRYLCQARCMSPPCPLRVPLPCPRRAPGAVASLCPAGETRGGLRGAQEPPGPAAPSCLPQAPSHNPPISPHLHAGSNCSWGRWWLINHGDDLLIVVTTWGPGESPVNPLPSSCAAGTNPASCSSWSRAVRSVRAVINLIVALSPWGVVAGCVLLGPRLCPACSALLPPGSGAINAARAELCVAGG